MLDTAEWDGQPHKPRTVWQLLWIRETTGWDRLQGLGRVCGHGRGMATAAATIAPHPAAESLAGWRLS